MAISITAIAGGVLLLGIGSSLQSATDATEQTIATGMAQQLMDEVLGGRYAAVGVGGYQINFSPSAWEQSGQGRQRYDDIDDYHGLRIQPPEDLWGIALGAEDGEGAKRNPNFQVAPGYFDHWREEINVYYVDETDLLSPLPYGQVSDYRMVEVRIIEDDPNRGARELARLRRVVAYVPPL